MIKANSKLNLQELQLQLFSCKNISKIASKTFATQCFLIDDLNHKTIKKETCRKPSANPLPIMNVLVEELLNRYLPVNFVFFLKSRLTLNMFFCFWTFVNKYLTYLTGSRTIAPRKLPPDNCPPDNYPRVVTLQVIALHT